MLMAAFAVPLHVRLSDRLPTYPTDTAMLPRQLALEVDRVLLHVR